jgi:outer membrane protein assembly factor BamB
MARAANAQQSSGDRICKEAGMTNAIRSPARPPAGAGRLAAVVAAAVVGTVALAATPAQASPRTRPASTWQTNGRVSAILDLGGVTYIGGSFTRVSDHHGHDAGVSNLAAFDAAGNLVARWTPRASSAVKVLAADGADILAGGAFTRVDGKTRLHLALISPDGSLRSFKGHTNKQVDTVVVSKGTAYVGGLFTKASGTSRRHVSAFAAADGRILPWNPSTDGRVDAIVAPAGRVVIGGMFGHVGRVSAPHLAAVDPATGSPMGWSAHAPASVLALAADNGTVFAGIGGRGGTIAAYSSSGGLRWQDQTDGNVAAITTFDGEVIAGGHYNNFCDPGTNCRHPVVRHKIAALSESNGEIDPAWHPSVNSRLGVFATLGTASRLEIGGDFTKVAGRNQAHFARFTGS